MALREPAMPELHTAFAPHHPQPKTSSVQTDEVFELLIPPDCAPYSLALERIGIKHFELEDQIPTPLRRMD